MKLRKPFTYFVDRSLGRHELVSRLRAAGLSIEAHDDHFAPDTPDEEWLTGAGKRNWIVLTKDKDVRRNIPERAAIVDSNVACFMLGRGDLSAERMAQAFLAAHRRIERALRRFHLAMAATVTVEGNVRMLLAGGALLDVPKHLK